jgi:hypothetical protein
MEVLSWHDPVLRPSSIMEKEKTSLLRKPGPSQGGFPLDSGPLALNGHSMPNDLTTPRYAVPRIVHSHLLLLPPVLHTPSLVLPSCLRWPACRAGPGGPNARALFFIWSGIVSRPVQPLLDSLP